MKSREERTLGNSHPPAVSIVVPCRNEAGHITNLVRDILDQEPLPDGRTWEILIADGMSDDGTREGIEALAQTNSSVRLVDNPGRIVSTGLNAAIRASQGEIIVRMDAHTQHATDYVRQCVAVLKEPALITLVDPGDRAATAWFSELSPRLSVAASRAEGGDVTMRVTRGHSIQFTWAAGAGRHCSGSVSSMWSWYVIRTMS